MFKSLREKFLFRAFFVDFQKKMYEKTIYELKRNHLLDCVLNSKSKGISDDALCDDMVVVSLTTYDKRINDVALTIESIMQGSVLPNKIILWLEDGLKGKSLPALLRNQIKRGLDVMYCKDIRSYKKIIPSLSLYPDACIITIDDDVLYDYDLVERLVEAYKENPNCIHASRARKMIFSSDYELESYMKWPLALNGEPISSSILQTGVGGVLYPPKSLHSDVFDEVTFTRLSPCGDDIWLYVMAVRNGYMIHKIETRSQDGVDYLLNESVQDIALANKNYNFISCDNDKQIKALFERYSMFDYLNN